MEDVYEFLKPSIPSDHCRQVTAQTITENLLRSHKPRVVLDLGCGTGSSYDFFRKRTPNSRWIGLDVETSPEVSMRTRDDAEFMTFDGINIPLKEQTVDLIYSRQVLEHVRHPEPLLREVRRVITKNGFFVGQTSQLEPYHSYSYWNFTIFGFKKICLENGLDLIELRPGIDGSTLFRRAYLGRPKALSIWFEKESPLNVEIEGQAKADGKGNQIVNFRKLMSCGQFCFICRPI